MCVEMGKMFLENVFIEQLLRTGIPFNSGASHKNTKSTKMGKMFLKSVFTECCSGVRMVLDAHSGIIDYLCKRNMTKEEIIERTIILPISFMCHERLFNVTSTFYVHRTS